MWNELERVLTPREEEWVQAAFWGLLRRQVALYTRDTSLAEETARELLASIRFSLEWYLGETNQPLDALLEEEPERLLRQAEAGLWRQVELTRRRYRLALTTSPVEESRSLKETLAGIAPFFQAYDVRYFAHRLPDACDIDYPLSQPVPEERQGVVYLREYLERLLLENAVLGRFPKAAAARVLGALCPGYRLVPVNLYELVAGAAIGVTLVEGDWSALDMKRPGQAGLTALLASRSAAERLTLLRQAGERLASRLELPGQAAAYLTRTAVDLAPRMEAVQANGGEWQGLFPAFSD